MDLGTINFKLKQKSYTSIKGIIYDIGLVWYNCKLYNRDDSQIYYTADKMEKLFIRRIKSEIAENFDYQQMIIEYEMQVVNKGQDREPGEDIVQEKDKFFAGFDQLDPERRNEVVVEMLKLNPNFIKEFENYDRMELGLDTAMMQEVLFLNR